MWFKKFLRDVSRQGLPFNELERLLLQFSKDTVFPLSESIFLRRRSLSPQTFARQRLHVEYRQSCTGGVIINVRVVLLPMCGPNSVRELSNMCTLGRSDARPSHPRRHYQLRTDAGRQLSLRIAWQSRTEEQLVEVPQAVFRDGIQQRFEEQIVDRCHE